MQMTSPSYRAAYVELPRVSSPANQVEGTRNLGFEVVRLTVRGSLVSLVVYDFPSRLV